MIDAVLEFQGDYRWMSNFMPCTVSYEGDVYASVEHAYQAAKTDEPSFREFIRSCPTAADAKSHGRRLAPAMFRPGWEEMKIGVMVDLVRQKMQQEPYRAFLAALPVNVQVQEGNRWGDKFWGRVRMGNTWVGANHMGQIIMQMRAELEVYGAAWYGDPSLTHVRVLPKVTIRRG